MSVTEHEREETGAKRFIMPMVLCLAIGCLYTLAVIKLNIQVDPPAGFAGQVGGSGAEGAGTAARGPSAALGNGDAAAVGRFLAFRGRAALSVAAAAVCLISAGIALALFVRGARTRQIVAAGLVLELAIAAMMPLLGAGTMANVARGMACTETNGPMWDFCATPSDLTRWTNFDLWVDILCSAATCAVVFAIFVVARSDERSGLPSIASSREKCVTVLLVAGSALLVAVMMRNNSFLSWAFADYLTPSEPPKAIAAYIAGTSTFIGSVQTAMLALVWFIALILLQLPRRRHAADPASAIAEPTSFSLYNLSAILAPVLSALASNLLGGS
jgi:hypothetical protein